MTRLVVARVRRVRRAGSVFDMKLRRSAVGHAVMTVKHDNILVENVHAGTIHRELHNAIAYCQTISLAS